MGISYIMFCVLYLKETHTKDADHTVSLEGELNQAVTRAQQMEHVVETLKQSEEQVRIEKDMIIENLNKEIESLRKRQEQTMNEQLKFWGYLRLKKC